MIANSLITSISTTLLVAAGFGAQIVRAENISAPSMPIEEINLTSEVDLKAPLPSVEGAVDQAVAAKKTGENITTKGATLGKIETEIENDLTLVTAKLNLVPDWKNLEIEDHGTFMQIKLPSTIVMNSGEFIDGSGPYLKKIAMFQVNDKDGALRFFLNQDAAKAKLATTAEVLGQRVVITIDHKKLEQLIEPSRSEAQGIAAASGEKVVAVQAANDAALPVAKPSDAVVKAASDDAIGSSQKSLNLKDKLMTAAAFCAALILMLVGASVWKNKKIISRRKQKGLDAIEPAAMKVLNNISVSGRQRLSLVQVGNQQILIGISPDNITFLTNVESKQRIEQASFANQLLNATPGQDTRLKVDQDSRRLQGKVSVQSAVTPRPGVKAKQVVQPSRVNVSVGDDGISTLTAKGVKNNLGSPDQPYDDITKMIRDRLKNMPPSA
jgi:flagellar biogenesis protein FliO